jgi:6-phosphogluconolactonase (cycloisomerase 2 family)
MPEIPVGAQIFDLVFHPSHSTVYTGLLTGHVRAFSYDDQGNHKRTFSVRPSKRSCRGLAINEDGTHLYAVGKSKALKCVLQKSVPTDGIDDGACSIIDTATENVEIRAGAHE